MANTLRWNSHVDYICAKAYQKLGFLRRHLRHANRDVRLAAYKCYVRPILEYAGCVWDPYRKQQVAQIERIQNLALRFVFSEYRRTKSVTAMRNEVGLDCLEKRRKVCRLKELYAVANGLTKINPAVYISPSTSRSKRTSNTKAIAPYQYRNDVFKYSFFCRTIIEWNTLPEEVVNCCSPELFEAQLNELFS